jgi:hypothetical protein
VDGPDFDRGPGPDRIVLFVVSESARARDVTESGFAKVTTLWTVAVPAGYALPSEALDLRFGEAARLLGQARRVLDEYGSPEDRYWPRMLEVTKAQAREALGEDGFEAAYAAGREGLP